MDGGDDQKAGRIRLVAALAGIMVGLGPVVALLQQWSDAITPTFFGLAMSVLGGVIGAIYVPRKMMDRIDDAVDRALSRRADPVVKQPKEETSDAG